MSKPYRLPQVEEQVVLEELQVRLVSHEIFHVFSPCFGGIIISKGSSRSVSGFIM